MRIVGLIYLSASLAYFFNMMPAGELSGNAGLFVTGIGASGYIMPLIKSLQLICAIALLSNQYVQLAVVVLFPITLNILLFHAFMAPDGMLVPLILLLGNLFLAFAYRDKYQPVLARK
jgi:putative oxidoreductase